MDCIDNVPRPFASELLVDSVVAAVDGFVAEHEQFDDLTVLAIAHSTHKRRVHLVPLDIASFALIRGHIMSCEADESLKRKACLACEEAFVNVVSHSGAEHAWYSVNESDGVLRVTIEDDGVAFDPLAVEPEEKSFEELDEGGMGIGLTRQLADEVAYAREDGHNILTICVNTRN